MAKYETFYTCPQCGSLVKKGARYCDCGYDFSSSTSKLARHILSIIVLFTAYILANIWEILAVILTVKIIAMISSLPVFVRLLVYLVAGATILGFILAPIIYGPAIVVSASNAVFPSKSGSRYRVFSYIYLSLASLNIIYSLISSDLNFSVIFAPAFCVSLLIYTALEYPKDKTIKPAIPITHEEKEKYAQERVDSIIAEMFAGQTNPFTGKPVESEDEYRSYLHELKLRQTSNTSSDN